MAIIVRYKQLLTLYWAVSGSNIQRLGLLNETLYGYVIDPTVLNGLGATKTSTLTAAQINTNFASTFNTDVIIPNASHFLQSNWNTLGWTTTNVMAFVYDLQNFILNNFSSGVLNQASRDMEIIIAFGTVNGSAYAVPVIYHGNGGGQATYFTTFITATGGNITTNGNFKVHTFLSSGTFQVTSGIGTVASLVVAGGGGGSGDSGAGGGGGGAGGLVYTTPGSVYGVGSYTVTVGAGGQGLNTSGTATNGGNSVFDVHTAIGGGSVSNSVANSGGSGGGADTAFVSPGGAGTGGQGNAGGNGFNGATNEGGGGGGSGGAGGNSTHVGTGGAGGLGTSNSITGSAVFYASGGGGGHGTGTGGVASAGGGGNGGATGQPGVSGTPNTGGGAGGGQSAIGITGGSGIVIVTYQFQ